MTRADAQELAGCGVTPGEDSDDAFDTQYCTLRPEGHGSHSFIGRGARAARLLGGEAVAHPGPHGTTPLLRSLFVGLRCDRPPLTLPSLGLYAKQLRLWLREFPASQISVVLLDDLKTPEGINGVCNRLWATMGLQHHRVEDTR